MSEYDNRGACWPNQHREKPTHPHFTGSMTVEGKDYWVNMWMSLNPEGNKPPVSFSVRPKDTVEELATDADPMAQLAGIAQPPGPEPPPPGDEEIPF